MSKTLCALAGLVGLAAADNTVNVMIQQRLTVSTF
jgi:hypothetical protein